MRRPVAATCTLILLLSLTAVFPAHAQERLSLSQVWFARALRERFPETMPVGDQPVQITRLWCTNSDITRFSATAKRNDATTGPAISIGGSVRLDPLPHGLDIVGGAFGEHYTLLLQAYVFTPDGTLVGSPHAVPENGARFPRMGGVATFSLEGKLESDIHQGTVIVVAIGDPVSPAAGGTTRVLLGMKTLPLQ